MDSKNIFRFHYVNDSEDWASFLTYMLVLQMYNFQTVKITKTVHQIKSYMKSQYAISRELWVKLTPSPFCLF
jgi:hypothetical protein